jgi:Zn ribbon nucleic-acid-binding protein
MWQNGVNNYTKKGGVMYAYVCDGCNAQDTYMWVAAGADVYLCHFCRGDYRVSPDFREDVKEWAQLKRDNNFPRRVLV